METEKTAITPVDAGNKDKLNELLAGKKLLKGIVEHVFGSVECEERRRHRKAVVVGIPDHVHPTIGRTCVRSAQRMKELLGQQFQTELIDDELSLAGQTGTGQQPYHERIREAVSRLLGESTKEDTLLFYYSGHGKAETAASVKKRNADAKELVLDMGAGDEYPISELLEQAHEHPYRSLILILDCCYSGNIGDGEIEGTFRQIPRNMCIITAGLPHRKVYALSSNASEAGLKQKYWMLSDRSDRDDKPVYKDYRQVEERMKYTYFSHHLIEALCGGAANPMGIVTFSKVYQYVSEALGTNVSGELYQVAVDVDNRCRPMMKGYLEHDEPLCYVAGILREEDLQAILDFRESLLDRKAGNWDTEGLGEMYDDSSLLERRKTPIPITGMSNYTLSRLMLLGLIKPMGKNFFRKQLTDVYKFTPRGWHYWELLQQIQPAPSNEATETAATPTVNDYQALVDKLYGMLKPFASGS